MPTTITFGPSDTAEQLGQPRVWTRVRWSDDWTRVEFLHPEEVSWSCLPVMPAATLLWHYGRLRYPDADYGPTTIDKLHWRPGRYIKIEIPCDLDEAATDAAGEPVFRTRYWYGVVEQIVDDQFGLFSYQPVPNGPGGAEDVTIATGSQRVLCLGLEHLLSRNRIRSSVFDRGLGLTGNDSTIPFNMEGGRGNRGTAEDGDPGDASYVFYFDLDGGAANVTTWSTREIVRYLLRRQSPRDHLNARAIKYRVHAASLANLPDWDLPYLDQDNATTLSLLQRLVDRRRLLTGWFDVVEDGGEEWVELHVDTIVPNPVQLTITPAARIEAASRQLVLDYDQDQATRGHVRDSGLGLWDRVICRGAKLISVASFSLQDGTLQRAWDPGDQSRYETGAVGTPGYAAAVLAERQRRDAAARSDPRLDDVFARFKIPASWDQRTGDGFGGVFANVFVGNGGRTPVYFPAMTLRGSLPLFAKVDYSLDAIQTGAAAAAEPKAERDGLPVASFWKRPKADADGTSRWFRGEEIGRLAKLEGVDPEDANRLTIHTHVVPHSHSVVFRVSGGHQHEIAFGDFTPNASDEKGSTWTYLNGGAIVTLALESGLRVEGQWPIVGPFGIDALRTLVLDAGDHYERIYMVPMTVLGISANGQLIRSNGGWIERPAGVVTRLEDLAHLAHAWYSIPHQIVSVESQRLLSGDSIQIGDLVTRVGDPAVANNPQAVDCNASISEITIRWEEGRDSDEPPAPSMRIETFAGELDALAVGPAGFEARGNPFKLRRKLKL